MMKIKGSNIDPCGAPDANGYKLEYWNTFVILDNAIFVK